MSFMGGRKAGHIEAESQSFKIVILKVLGKKNLSVHPSVSFSGNLVKNELVLSNKNIRVHELYSKQWFLESEEL